VERVSVAVAEVRVEQQVDGVGVRELGLVAEAAEDGVVRVVRGVQHVAQDLVRELVAIFGRCLLRALAIGDDLGDLLLDRRLVVAIVGADLFEHVAHLVGRDVGHAGHDLAVGRQERGGRPAAHVVAGVDVGALVVIDAHGDEALVDQADDVVVGVRRLVHDVAPVAPHCGDAEEHGLLLVAGALEGGGAPFVPGDLGGAVRPGGEVEGVGSGHAGLRAASSRV
jgi:hypothetical protein